MGIFLWVLQVVMSLVFLGSGVSHITLPPDLPANFAWMYDIAPVPNTVIGVLELAAALGLILPGVTRIQTRLTSLAALGLMLTMIGAVIFHVPRAEFSNVTFNVIFFVMASIVAYGRWRIRPFMDRSAA